MPIRNLILCALLAWGGWNYWTNRPQEQAPGILASNAPLQIDVGETPVMIDGYTLTPRARFEIKARVLSRENYRLGREADLSPVDLALGWEAMSDTKVLEKIDISQSGRSYFWHTESPPIPFEQIAKQSANMHMIPANAEVRARLQQVRRGQVIRISAQLVDVASSDGWQWHTSLTRDDTGAGACEVLLVQDLVF